MNGVYKVQANSNRLSIIQENMSSVLQIMKGYNLRNVTQSFYFDYQDFKWAVHEQNPSIFFNLVLP